MSVLLPTVAVFVMLVVALVLLGALARRSARVLGVGCLGVLILVLAAGFAALLYSHRGTARAPTGAVHWEQFDAVENALASDVEASVERASPAEERPEPSAESAEQQDDAPGIVLDSDDVRSDSSAEEESPGEPAIIPPGRPYWVDGEPVREGRLHRTAVASGPHLRMLECRRALDRALRDATDEYIDWHLRRPNASTWVRYDVQYIKTNLLRPDNVYHELLQPSVGPMHQLHALLEFDEGFRQELDGRWEDFRATSRLLQIGLGSGLILAFVATLFAFFRVDTATRGYYTRRLQFAAAAAILAMIAAGALLAKWIPWV
jgi:hypothetical protein